MSLPRALWLFLAVILGACQPRLAGSLSCEPGTCDYEPHCGDGVCSSEESWQSCPADCPQALPDETCNGRDDDGDSQVDEGDPGGGGSCPTGLPGHCASGVLHCRNGSLTCVAAEPIAEVCNGQDDNCDGQADEGDPEGGVSCLTGKPGMCSAGVQHCQSGMKVCEVATSPSPEVCNGRDDDCNGQIDDGDPGGGAPCDTGQLGVCGTGVMHCTAAGLSCEPTTRPGPEICNGVDDDCNGKVDEVCTPGSPVLRLPTNGAYTGSLWATRTARLPLRPTFGWDAQMLATRYQLQLDDSCTPGAIGDCAFSSAEVDLSVTETTWTPAKDLPVSKARPVGTLYAWRVRACHVDMCSPWSMVRYVRVGRLPDDYNGDGYGDVVLGGSDDSHTDYGMNWQKPGDFSGMEGLFGTTTSVVARAGDVNGDGFSDAVMTGTRNGTPAVYLFLGSLKGFGQPALILTDPDGDAASGFGSALAGAADVDADGLDDVVVGAPQASDGEGLVHAYAGSVAEGLVSKPRSYGLGDAGMLMGTAVALGDMDADGFADVLAGAPRLSGAPNAEGAALLMKGSAAGMARGISVTIHNPSKVAVGFGSSIVACDFDGDGRLEMAVAADYPHPFEYSTGEVDVITKTKAGVSVARLPDPNPTNVGYGAALAAADFDGDGLCDLAVGSPLAEGLEHQLSTGLVDFYQGADGGLTSTVWTTDRGTYLVNEPPQQFGSHLAALDWHGDGHPLLLVVSTNNGGSLSTSSWSGSQFNLDYAINGAGGLAGSLALLLRWPLLLVSG